MRTNAKFWDDLAEKYAARPVKDPAAFQRKQAIMRELVPPDAVVLEIGCGTGSLALAMSPFAAHIHAMDISAEMLRIANGKRAAQGVANVTFRQGTLDGDSNPYAGEHFDSIWAYSILHLVPDRRRVLAAIFELLKPGGSFISSNACLGGTWVPYGVILPVLRWLGKAPEAHIYDRKTIFSELHEAGFAEIEERDVGAERVVAFIVARKP